MTLKTTPSTTTTAPAVPPPAMTTTASAVLPTTTITTAPAVLPTTMLVIFSAISVIPELQDGFPLIKKSKVFVNLG